MRSLKLPVAAVLAVALAACGGAAATQAPTQAPTQAATDAPTASPARQITIALVLNRQNDPFYISLVKGAQAKADELGVKLIYQAPAEQSVENQTAVLNSVMAQRPDGLLFSAADAAAMSAPVKQIFAGGVPVIAIDTDVADTSARHMLIGSDNKALGLAAAEAMSQLLGGQGTVGLLTYQPGVQSVDDRNAGWLEGIAKVPGFTDAGIEYAGLDVAEYERKAAGVIARTPGIGGFYTTWSNAALGASQAIATAGKRGEIMVVGTDASPDAVTSLRNEAIDAIVSQKPLEMGARAVQLMYDLIMGGPAPTENIFIDSVIVTRDNIDNSEVAKYFYTAE